VLRTIWQSVFVILMWYFVHRIDTVLMARCRAMSALATPRYEYHMTMRLHVMIFSTPSSYSSSPQFTHSGRVRVASLHQPTSQLFGIANSQLTRWVLCSLSSCCQFAYDLLSCGEAPTSAALRLFLLLSLLLPQQFPSLKRLLSVDNLLKNGFCPRKSIVWPTSHCERRLAI
jgi:hypothetical protein